ncbi:MAG TPA: hypothetical protein VIK55_06790 [Paludibacter sp.]
MKQRGGKREGSGAKLKADKKKQVSCYFLESDILSLGKSECQKVAQNAVHEAALLSWR